MTTRLTRPVTSVRASVSSDGLVLLDLHGGLLLASNGVGARIWQLLEAGYPAPAIASRLVAEYGVPLTRAQDDVAGFVAALSARGLVTEEEA